MKTRFLFPMALLTVLGFAPMQASDKNKDVKYNFLVNEVPEDFDMPMIGLINTAHGNQYFFQLGLINSIEGNLEGAQIGLLNSVERDMEGVQVGFINATEHDQKGVQAGFINAVDNNFLGLEMGFINAIGDRIQGIQAGFINVVEKVEGFQIGFINATENLNGFQVGFTNVAERANGAQVGFFNANEVLDGFQLGIINWSDRIKNGTPVGIFSFVRHGGLKAFELNFNEMYPYNLSFKSGVDKFYTFPIVSYDPNRHHSLAVGYGIGSLVPMNEEVYFNPELISQTVLSGEFDQLISLGLQFGHQFTDNMHFLAGPTLVWNRSSDIEPLFALRKWTIDGNDKVHIGLRASLRYCF